MSASIDRLGQDVLSRYPTVFQAAPLLHLGNRGGFSGARLWRVETGGQSFCLRAWPTHQSDPSRLDFLHGLMRRARSAGLAFVPAVIATSDGHDHVEHGGRLWDLTEWLPGVADFHADPSPARLEAAAASLARVHLAWEQLFASANDVCPALQRRLSAAAGWQELRRSGWPVGWQAGHADPVQPVAERAWRIVDRRVADIPPRLQPWTDSRRTLQPCLCDVWHDHLLFTGDRLTGLIDYGAARVDHPAADVARMFGSLVPDDASAWQLALRAYRAVRPLGSEEAEMALALDETGTVIGVATWLRWLYEEFRPYEDRTAVARRLDLLVGRVERWDK
jgi:Ser/Thr protein kinase RdoA (MazF antagonist)